MTDRENDLDNYFSDLQAISNLSFPKKCANCGKIYESPDDFISHTEKIHEEKITRTAIVIISNVIDSKTYEYSKLYDKKFSHGYRKSKIK